MFFKCTIEHQLQKQCLCLHGCIMYWGFVCTVALFVHYQLHYLIYAEVSEVIFCRSHVLFSYVYNIIYPYFKRSIIADLQDLGA